jgi:hypothetical protein
MPLSVSTCSKCRSYRLLLVVVLRVAAAAGLSIGVDCPWSELVVWLEGWAQALTGHYKTWSVWACPQPACCNAHVSKFRQVWSAMFRG